MFLTKKNGGITAKPKQKPKNQKALGGWDDDDEEQTTPKGFSKPTTKMESNLLDDPSYSTPIQVPDYSTGAIRQAPIPMPVKKTEKISQQQNTFIEIEQLENMQNIECEVKLVESISEPGGIRMKPTDVQLQEFCKESKMLNISVVGSLLIGILYDPDTHFQSKTKSLATIQYLCKKNVQYSVYFKLHSQKIQNSPDPSQNSQSYLKIKKNVLHAIGLLVVKPDQRKNEDLIGEPAENGEINFIDPGYNDTKQDKMLKDISTIKKTPSDSTKEKGGKKLISPNDLIKGKNKKVLAGPKGHFPTNKIEKKKSEDFDLLGDSEASQSSKQKKENQNLDLLSSEPQEENRKIKASTQQEDLLDFGHSKPSAEKEKLTFDELMAKQNKGKNNQFDFHL